MVQMTVTWTSGYGKKDADAVVQWGTEVGKDSWISPASTLTFTRQDMCGRSQVISSGCKSVTSGYFDASCKLYKLTDSAQLLKVFLK